MLFSVEILMYDVGHLPNNGNVMATKGINAKSKRFDVRVPHEVADAVEALKEQGESTGQFVVTALEREIKFRERKKHKSTNDQ